MHAWKRIGLATTLLVSLGAAPLAAENPTSGFLESLAARLRPWVSYADAPLRLVVDDPWQRNTSAEKGRLETIRVYVRGRRNELISSRLQLVIVSRRSGRVVWRSTILGPRTSRVDLPKDGLDLPWGMYRLQGELFDAAGRRRAATVASVTILPDGQHRVEVLNNLVSELVNARERGVLKHPEIPFMNPRDGWCFFRVSGEAAIALDANAQPLLVCKKGQQPAEAMRKLAAGRHLLRVRGRPENVIVRAIPAVFYNVYRTGTRIKPFGIQTWDVLEKHYLHACNTIESFKPFPEEMARWRSAGGEWVVHAGIPEKGSGHPISVEQAIRCWQESPGYSHPRSNGVQVDEFTSAYSDAEYDTFTEAVARVAKDPGFAGRQFIPFVTIDPNRQAPGQFMRVILAAGWPFSIEIYIAEQPGEEAARREIDKRLAGSARRWQRAMPGSIRRAVIAPMFSALPHCMANARPDVDFKVHLDMQMHLLANDPALFGLYGVQPYRSNYTDPETLQWTGRLLRHYCIEGRTKRFSKLPYELRHLRNPDFEAGAEHWQLRPAAPGSITTGHLKGYGRLEGRYGFIATAGDRFLLTTRSAKAPNVFSQPIAGLTPGRLYSLKMITADYRDLTAGRSRRSAQALSIRLEGVDVLPGKSNAFTCPFVGAGGHGEFTGAKRPQFDYHWRVFRAKAATGRLTITDWANDREPGGPIGQQLMFNFLELQPHEAEYKPPDPG